MGEAEWQGRCCPLCGATALRALSEVRGRAYAECGRCGLSLMHPRHWPSAAEAEAEYANHRNDVADSGYRAFLDRLAQPLCERLAPAADGLDYGCGPGPALVALLRERGHDCAGYDPIFAPEPERLQRRYDFVTCTEVAEHFTHPRAEFERLAGLLKPGGWLAVMTQWRLDSHVFERWRYVHDPTHVVFFRERSLRWIADALGLGFESPSPNVALMRAPI